MSRLFATHIHTNEIGDIYRRFADTIGDKCWRARVRTIKESYRYKPLVQKYYEDEHKIAFQLSRIHDLQQRYGAVSHYIANDSSIYPAAGFAAQILSLIESASKDEASKIRSRVRGAFQQTGGIRGMQLELQVASHFLSIGRRVSWTEEINAKMFDLLVEREGDDPLEVECKAISEDTGRKIRRIDVIEFFTLMQPHLSKQLGDLNTGLAVILTVPERLPADHRGRLVLGKAISRAILGGAEGLPYNASFRQNQFDTRQLTNVPENSSEYREVIDRVTSTVNKSACIFVNPHGGILLLIIQSEKDDKLLKVAFDKFAEATKEQLTGTRAGMVVAEFEGLSRQQMFSVAQQDNNPSKPPTALRVASHEFFLSESRSHVVGIGLLSHSEIQKRSPAELTSAGVAYYFPNRDSSFWSESFSGIFPEL